MTTLNGQLSISNGNARNYVLAGNATVTIRSNKTGKRFTYKIQTADDGNKWFVKLLQGPDNTSDFGYMGMITDSGQFVRTRATKMSSEAISFKAWLWTWNKIQSSQDTDALEIWHEGTCGRCNKKLTVPSSIEAGIGPKCATHIKRTHKNKLQ